MTLWRVLGILFLSLWYFSGPREWSSRPCFLLFKTIVRELRAVFSVAQLCCSLQPHELQHARLPYPLLSPWVRSNSHPLSHWCHPTISSRRRQWHPTPVLLPGKSHGRRSLEGCSPWGRWGSGTTERLHFHSSLWCIWEGNGNPLQCSCLEDPRDEVAWWAAIYGVAQGQTQLKWLSSLAKEWSINTKKYCRAIKIIKTTFIQTQCKWIPTYKKTFHIIHQELHPETIKI